MLAAGLRAGGAAFRKADGEAAKGKGIGGGEVPTPPVIVEAKRTLSGESSGSSCPLSSGSSKSRVALLPFKDRARSLPPSGRTETRGMLAELLESMDERRSASSSPSTSESIARIFSFARADMVRGMLAWDCDIVSSETGTNES